MIWYGKNYKVYKVSSGLGGAEVHWELIFGHSYDCKSTLDGQVKSWFLDLKISYKKIYYFNLICVPSM